MYIWTSEDPWTFDANGMMIQSQFIYHLQERLGTYDFDADLAHLIGTHRFGGIAGLGILCQEPGFRGAISGVYMHFENAPVYSWSVKVIAHEMGHQLGAGHTHACIWGPEGKDAIDCCGDFAGWSHECGELGLVCNAPTHPEHGGTIMSY